MSYGIRYETSRAHYQDASTIEEIVNNAIGKSDYFRKEGLPRISASDIQDNIKYQEELHWYVLIQIEKTETIGATVLYESKTPSKGSIHMFCRRDGAIYKGAGAILLENVILKENIEKLSLWCADVPKLVTYYNNLGFIHSGKRKAYDPTYLKEEMKGKIFIVHMEKKIRSSFSEIVRIKIDLPYKQISDSHFHELIKRIKSNPEIQELRITKTLLKEEQIKQLIAITSRNEYKGFKITTTEGKNLGSAYTNWEVYANEKRSSHIMGMYEVTKVALDLFIAENKEVPQFILDFGAGTGQDTINLVRKGCPKVWAVDGDEYSLKILQEEVSKDELLKGKQENIVCIASPFIHLIPGQPVELLVSSYTLPYRCSDDFPACFKKCIESLKIGGYLSGHFFGPRAGKNPDPGMTYHTEEELKNLLSNNFEILWYRKDPEGGSFTIYGGNEEPWGDLHHVVAKRVK